MAIKNTALGGTDWVETDFISTTFTEDLNDTFDAAASKIKTLSAFWLNSFLFETYDDFESYSTGTFTSNSLWDVVTASGSGPVVSTVTIETDAAGKYLRLYSVDEVTADDVQTATVTSNSMDTNKHIYVAGGFSMNGEDSRQTMEVLFGNSTDGFTSLGTIGIGSSNGAGNLSVNWNVFIVAKGGNEYDCYLNGTLAQEALSKPNGSEIRFKTSSFDNPATGTQTAIMSIPEVIIAGSETT